MASIKGISNSAADIEKRKAAAEKSEHDKVLKTEIKYQEDIFLQKFKDGAEVKTVQKGEPKSIFKQEIPSVKNVYDKEHNLLYTETKTSKDTKYTYKYNDREVMFFDRDNDGNLDYIKVKGNNSSFIGISSKDDGVFDIVK